MAYETGSASDQTDLMNKLQVFAAANGYTVEHYDGNNRLLYISRSADSLYAGFYWDGTNNIALYQALGFTADNVAEPWTMPDDSGNGHDNLAQIYRGRNVNNIGNGPFPTYYFFGYTNPYSIHVVLEFSAGIYRHFGFGKLDKVGSWTGGAWVAGHHWNAQWNEVALGDPDHYAHSILLDGAHNNSSYYYSYSYYCNATMHAEELPLQEDSSKWAVSCSPILDSRLGDDRAGNSRVRIIGGCRGGIALTQFGWLVPNLANGFVPLIPMEVFHIDGLRSSSISRGWHHLGRLHNVYHLHMHGIDPAQEISYGGSTYMVFPGVRKSRVGNKVQESWNMGIVYKKVT